jgi:hypothetical protein
MDDNELVFYKDSDGKIMSGGYLIQSSFLTNDDQVMTTMNGGNALDESISQAFETLAIPAGLFYINYQHKRGGCPYCDQKGGNCGCDVSYRPVKTSLANTPVEPHQCVNDDLHDRLMKMVEDNEDEHKHKQKKMTKRNKSASIHKITKRKRVKTK